jgi:hypothetical protein
VKRISNLLFGLALLSCLPAVAQQPEDKVSSIFYFNQFNSGGLISKKKNPVAVSARTIHGVGFRNWRLGVGISFDNYGSWQLFPVVGIMSYDFAAVRANRFYFQVAYGPTLVRHVDSANDNVAIHEGGGTMGQPLIGYRITKDKWTMCLGVGYRFQTIAYAETPRWSRGIIDEVSRNTVERNMQRVYLQLGFGFK